MQALITSAQKVLVNKVERVEHNRFRQSDRENRVHEDRRESARVATDRRGHAKAGKTDADPNAHGGKTDVNASANFCQ
jgi:hypothetical protein